jgi:hypothetical protein
MPTQEQIQNVNSAVAQLRSAEVLLLQASRRTGDDTRLIQINNEYCLLDTVITQLVSAAAAADDTTFRATTGELKQQAQGLDQDQDNIKKIVGDVATAAEIAGYVAQAATIIAAL